MAKTFKYVAKAIRDAYISKKGAKVVSEITEKSGSFAERARAIGLTSQGIGSASGLRQGRLADWIIPGTMGITFASISTATDLTLTTSTTIADFISPDFEDPASAGAIFWTETYTDITRAATLCADTATKTTDWTRDTITYAKDFLNDKAIEVTDWIIDKVIYVADFWTDKAIESTDLTVDLLRSVYNVEKDGYATVKDLGYEVGQKITQQTDEFFGSTVFDTYVSPIDENAHTLKIDIDLNYGNIEKPVLLALDSLTLFRVGNSRWDISTFDGAQKYETAVVDRNVKGISIAGINNDGEQLDKLTEELAKEDSLSSFTVTHSAGFSVLTKTRIVTEKIIAISPQETRYNAVSWIDEVG